MIRYIQNITDRSKVIHMGHSMGTTSFYAMLAKKPKLNDEIYAHISLAPVAFMNRMRSLEVLRPIILLIRELIVSIHLKLFLKSRFRFYKCNGIKNLTVNFVILNLIKLQIFNFFF